MNNPLYSYRQSAYSTSQEVIADLDLVTIRPSQTEIATRLKIKHQYVSVSPSYHNCSTCTFKGKGNYCGIIADLVNVKGLCNRHQLIIED